MKKNNPHILRELSEEEEMMREVVRYLLDYYKAMAKTRRVREAALLPSDKDPKRHDKVST